MRTTSLWLSTSLLSAISTVSALNVTAGSDCEALCREGSASAPTTSSDIVCEDNDFLSSSNGIGFRSCVECLQESSATSGSDSDVTWFLYNVRYAFDVCLYTFPEAADEETINSPCNIDGACGGLEDALTTSLLETDSENQFNYCQSTQNFTDGDDYRGCLTCLRSTSNQKYLANFLVALRAGCEQQPEAGQPVSLSGSIFSTSIVNITEPLEDIRDRPSGAGTGTLTTGAIVGIAVGCALLFLGAGCLIFIHCRRQRRDAARLKLDSPQPDTPGGPGFIGSVAGGPKDPFGGSSSHKMSESISSYRELGHQRAYSSNAAYYDKLETDIRTQGIGLKYHHPAPTLRGNNIVGSLPAHPAYIPRAMSRASDRSQTPPVLPQPPAATAARDNSYAMESYLRYTENTGVDLSAAQHSRSFSHPTRRPAQPKLVGTQGIPPPPPPAPKSKIPSLVLPSIPKFKGSKVYEPPQVLPQETPGDAASVNRDVHISGPLAASSGSRFHDRPLGAGPVIADQAPMSFNEHQKAFDKKTSPIMSGNSANVRLYG